MTQLLPRCQKLYKFRRYRDHDHDYHGRGYGHEDERENDFLIFGQKDLTSSSENGGGHQCSQMSYCVYEMECVLGYDAVMLNGVFSYALRDHVHGQHFCGYALFLHVYGRDHVLADESDCALVYGHDRERDHVLVQERDRAYGHGSLFDLVHFYDHVHEHLCSYVRLASLLPFY